MSAELVAFARRVCEEAANRTGFETTQRIQAGSIDISARVRFRRPDACSVEFSRFDSPLLALEERLLNGAEFAEDEMKGMLYVFDGTGTWIHDPSSSFALRRPGRAIPEPLPGYRAFTDIALLETLTRDALLQDGGVEQAGSRKIRTIRIKPKAPVRPSLLSVTSFPYRRATLQFDEETCFPVRVEFLPPGDTLLATLLPPEGHAVIEYTNTRESAPDPDVFRWTPPDETRRFEERLLPMDAVSQKTPFPCRLDPVRSAGFEPLPGESRLCVDAEGHRGFFTLIAQSRTEDEGRSILTLRCGNYLSRNMNRRRAALSNRGEPVTLGEGSGRWLDRSADWESAAAKRRVMEITWEVEGTYWFLLGDGMDRDALIGLASQLRTQNPPTSREA